MTENILEQKSLNDILQAIALNLVKKRKALKLSQRKLSEKSNVSLSSLKRFESRHEISLASLVKLAFVLDCEDDFLELFSKNNYASIEDVIREQS